MTSTRACHGGVWVCPCVTGGCHTCPEHRVWHGWVTIRVDTSAVPTCQPPPSGLDRAAGGDAGATPSENGQARLGAWADHRHQALAVIGGITQAHLVELRSLEEEMEVVLPGEADATVHLQAGRHHPPGGVAAPHFCGRCGLRRAVVAGTHRPRSV